MFGEEKALPYCGPQKPQHKGLRAKGEVITMLSEPNRNIGTWWQIVVKFGLS